MSFRIVVCASGGGGNFQALIDAREDSGVEISLLVVDRQCGAIERAVANGIDYVILDGTKGKDALFVDFEKVISEDTDLIVLAGFMPIIPSLICEKWQRRMINIHPSLLPKYGGHGMYGVKVQEAVMRANEQKAGCTVHYVDSGIDEGEVVMQTSIDVDYNETPWQLGGRIFKEENKLLVEAIRYIKADAK